MDLITMIECYGAECSWLGHYQTLGNKEAVNATQKEIKYQLTKIKEKLKEASQQTVEAAKCPSCSNGKLEQIIKRCSWCGFETDPLPLN